MSQRKEGANWKALVEEERVDGLNEGGEGDSKLGGGSLSLATVCLEGHYWDGKNLVTLDTFSKHNLLNTVDSFAIAPQHRF